MENRKTKYTKKVMHDALFELIEKEPLNEITVKELTLTADINRSTFYAYYDSISDLISEMEGAAAKRLIQVLESRNYDEKDFKDAVIGKFIDIITEDHEMAFWLFDENVTGSGRKLLHDYSMEKFTALWMKNQSITMEEASLSFEYIYNGCMGMMKSWYDNVKKTDTELVKKTFRILSENTLMLLHK